MRALVQLLGPCITLATALAQVPPVTQGQIPTDDQKGRFINFETAPLAPLLFSGSPARLYALNQPGARITLFDPQTLDALDEIRVGLGGVSLVERPHTDELWLVDRVGSCVSVIARDQGTLVRTIRVGREPHGIAFTDSGDRAYVTCSAVDQVDVIDAASYTVVNSIPIPARHPRGIVYHQGSAYVVSWTSGNNTAPLGLPDDAQAIVGVARVEGPGLEPLPDRDLFVIRTQPTAAADALDEGATLSGLGTMLFNIHRRPGTDELWIPNTDALNAEHVGEVNFVAGQVVKNRITIVDASGSASPRFIDLDALAPEHMKCAQPMYVAFDPVAPRAFVCGYGSDAVAVLDVTPGAPVRWRGLIQLPSPMEYPFGIGPRACAVDAAGERLFVYNKQDNSIVLVDLAALPSTANFHYVASLPTPLGYNPLTNEEWLGRHLFNNARFSKSQTSSCASCHVDGHFDGLAWDLSSYLDPEGTDDQALGFGTDVKGPMVTQSMRRMEDSGPYHWRGERGRIDDFNQTFVALLEHEVNGETQTIGSVFKYLKHYVSLLAYAPNPRQSVDRRFSAEELEGAALFMNKPVLGNLACADCHVLPLGTAGEIVAEVAPGVITSGDVPQLRGIGDKLSPEHLIGGAFGRRSELGAGLTHGGAFPSIASVALQTVGGAPKFDIDAHEAERIERFLLAFDTGLAPSTGYVITAWSGNHAALATGELAFLRNQAERGMCDLVYIRAPDPQQGNFTCRTGMYVPSAQQFRQAQASLPLIDASALLLEAANGKPVTFVGMPLGMGLAQGLDRDLDGAFDEDELLLGTNHEHWDTDGDKYADGYEVRWAMDPLQPDTSSPDGQAPKLAGPARTIFTTTNTLKFEFTTDEPCRVEVAVNGGGPLQRLPLGHHSDTQYSIVVNELLPDTNYVVDLKLRDDAGNVAVDSSTVLRTRALALPAPAHVHALTPSIVTAPDGSLHMLTNVALHAGYSPAAAGYVIDAALYHVDMFMNLTEIAADAHTVTQAGGAGNVRVPLPAPGTLQPGVLVFVLTGAHAPAGAVPYASGLNAQSVTTLNY